MHPLDVDRPKRINVAEYSGAYTPELATIYARCVCQYAQTFHAKHGWRDEKYLPPGFKTELMKLANQSKTVDHGYSKYHGAISGSQQACSTEGETPGAAAAVVRQHKQFVLLQHSHYHILL